MKTLLVIPLLLSSCTFASKDHFVAIGGQSAYKGRDFGVVTDQRDSFRAAATLAALGVGAWQSVAATKATEATAQIAAKEATKQNAAKLAAEVEQAEIAADVTKATFVPPP